jgi:hypothetical protein
LGFIVSECFVRIPGIRERFDTAPVCGATGAQISYAELLVPYLMAAFFLVITYDVIATRRQQNGLEPIPLPNWLMYLPIGVVFLVTSVALWSWITYSRRR